MRAAESEIKTPSSLENSNPAVFEEKDGGQRKGAVGEGKMEVVWIAPIVPLRLINEDRMTHCKMKGRQGNILQLFDGTIGCRLCVVCAKNTHLFLSPTTGYFGDIECNSISLGHDGCSDKDIHGPHVAGIYGVAPKADASCINLMTMKATDLSCWVRQSPL